MDTRHADQALAALSARKTEWARQPIQDKISYLKQIRQLALTHAQRWADAETKAKQLTPGSPLIGAEAWIAGPYGVISWLTASIQTLTTLDAGDDLLAHVRTRRSADGTLIARVLPAGTHERLLFHGVTAEVWMQDGVTEQNLRQNMAGFYRQADPDGAVALVLGAGNVSAIVPLDILDRMINCGQAAPDAETLGAGAIRLYVPDADPAQDHHGFRTEFFGPAMITSLPGDARQYLRRAVEFCNDRLYGTLSVNIIVHPATRKQLGTDYESAIAGLRYGGIGINACVGAAFLLPGPPGAPTPGTPTPTCNPASASCTTR